MNWKDVWKCVLTISGAQSVIVAGRLQKLQWPVDRQDSHLQVCL